MKLTTSCSELWSLLSFQNTIPPVSIWRWPSWDTVRNWVRRCEDKPFSIFIFGPKNSTVLRRWAIGPSKTRCLSVPRCYFFHGILPGAKSSGSTDGMRRFVRLSVNLRYNCFNLSSLDLEETSDFGGGIGGRPPHGTTPHDIQSVFGLGESTRYTILYRTLHEAVCFGISQGLVSKIGSSADSFW